MKKSMHGAAELVLGAAAIGVFYWVLFQAAFSVYPG